MFDYPDNCVKMETIRGRHKTISQKEVSKMTVKIKGFSKERENFARECGAVEALVYNDLHDEVHQLGIEQYENDQYMLGKADEIGNKIHASRELGFSKFHKAYSEYSYKAFAHVFNFILGEGREMAQEREMVGNGW